jgi:hypothetical protein
MMIVVLIAGLGVLLAGLLAVAYGIPIKEFGFGNTLIVTGAVAACTGAMMLVLWIIVRELKNTVRALGRGIRAESGPGNMSELAGQRPEDGDFPFRRDSAAINADSAESLTQPPQWQDEPAASSRDRRREDTPSEPEHAAKPQRGNLFFSSSRRERERAAGRAADPSMSGLDPAPSATPPGEAAGVPPPGYEDAWQQPGRSRTPEAPRRSGRAPSTPGPRADRQSPAAQTGESVTVLKSGVVDGMAYSLYSDGSIEAQMPEGMMRFGSIDELRAHLDQRP